MGALATSPLQLGQLARETWGSYDAAAIAQLYGLADDACYQMRVYKAPADDQELVPAYGNVRNGLEIKPGSLIFGFALPCVVMSDTIESNGPQASFTVQIRDVSLERDWFDDPLAGLFLANYKPTSEMLMYVNFGDDPCLPSDWNFLCAPYPVVGSGLFMVDIQSTANATQRIELVFGVLEVCG